MNEYILLSKASEVIDSSLSRWLSIRKYELSFIYFSSCVKNPLSLSSFSRYSEYSLELNLTSGKCYNTKEMSYIFMCNLIKYNFCFRKINNLYET